MHRRSSTAYRKEAHYFSKSRIHQSAASTFVFLLLPFVYNLSLNDIVGHLFDEQSHTAMIALDDHTNSDIWIPGEVDDVLTLWTNAL